MGIKGLNTWIHQSFPGMMLPIGNAGAPYDHVCFDLNGIVHQACRKRGSEKLVLKAIVAELDALLRLFPAQRTVLIALDGPGPTAKLMEQRKRRIDKVLKAARDAEALIPGSAENLRRLELCRLEGRPPPSASQKKKRKSCDSLQVTPGTLFMSRLRRVLEWYAASRVSGVGGVFRDRRPTVLVSAADVAGEGELKLLQHVQMELRQETHRRYGSACFSGTGNLGGKSMQSNFQNLVDRHAQEVYAHLEVWARMNAWRHANNRAGAAVSSICPGVLRSCSYSR